MVIDLNLIASALAIAVSIIALLRQSHGIRTAQTMQFTVDTLLRDVRTDDFQERQQRVLTELDPTIHDPSLGISRLPSELSLAAWHVLFVYEIFGMMVARGMVDKDMLLSISKYRICATWEALYPYIEAERNTIRGAPFVPFYEDFYIQCRRTSLVKVYARLKLKRVDAKRWPDVLERDDWPLRLG